MRNKLYWLLDSIKGGKIRSHLNEIGEMITSPESNSSIQRKETYLKKLLQQSVNNTSYYRQFKGYKSLEDFPVVNKSIIQENYKKFQSSEFDFSSLSIVSTSGSTGMPFKVHQSKEKRQRNHADALFFQNFAGYEVGDPLCFLRIWNEINRKSKLYHFKHNTYPIDISDLSEKSVKKIISQINDLPNNCVLLAYGTTFEVLADYIMKNSVDISVRVKCCLIMSESISTEIRNFMSEHLECPVLSRYSNSENGFLAHQFEMESTDYLVNTASYHIELLDFEKDTPVRAGEPGRVVVTDFFNFAVPFIRYDTGDIAVLDKKIVDGHSVPVFKRIEGRKLDFIHNSSGELISPHTIDYGVRQTPGLIQFQLIQTGVKHYTLKLLVKDRDVVDEDLVIENMRKYLGQDAEIDVHHVEELPVLSSGKRKIVVNEMSRS